MSSMSQWITIYGNDMSQTNGYLVWNNSTNTWYVNIIFPSESVSGNTEWISGVWYYRLLVNDNETLTNATDWGVFRLENTQPQNIVLSFNDPSGTAYHRVIDSVGYSVSFSDLNADNSSALIYVGTEFTYSMYITVRDQYANYQSIQWNTSSPVYYNLNHAKVNVNTFTMKSAFSFATLVDISRNDSYNQILFTIQTNDIDWPEVATLRYTSQNFTVLDCIPTAVAPGISSNLTNDQVYRNNGVTIDLTLNDPDDLPTNVTPQYLNLTYTDHSGAYHTMNLINGLTMIGNSVGNFIMISNYTWQYVLFVDIHNATGTWTFTTNFLDWDNNTLGNGAQVFSFKVLNNLPQLDFLQLKDLQTGEVAYGGNLTSFGVYRGGDTIQATAYVHDVEDTHLDTTSYSISGMNFDLIDPIEYFHQPTGYLY